MELNEVKMLLKSLIVSKNQPYTIAQLMNDFRMEAGVSLPKFNFNSVYGFLKSLTDIIEIYGTPPNEKIKLVGSKKSEHIASLIRRQGKMRYCHFREPEIELPADFTETCTDEDFDSSSEELEEESFKEDHVKDKNFISLDSTILSNDLDDYLFKEDEIVNLVDGNERSVKSDQQNCNETVKTRYSGSCEDTDSEINLTSSSQSSSYVNESLKAKLRKLIKGQKKGLWCSELPDYFNEYFKTTLDFREYGYRSLIEMVMDLGDIFRHARPDNGDWLLFDASGPQTEEELVAQTKSFTNIPDAVQKNILDLISAEGNTEIHVDDFFFLYYDKFNVKLNISEYGFRNIYEFMERLNGKILQLVPADGRTIIKPIVSDHLSISPPATVEITPDDDIFAELFPSHVVPSGKKYPVLSIEEHFSVGEAVDVIIAEVWSPYKFFIQLKKFEEEFDALMSAIQSYYRFTSDKLKMPEATVQVGQICVVVYNAGAVPEWHRSVITSVNPESVEVMLVDYGTCISVVKDDLLFLNRNFFNFPVQSFHAKLCSIKHSSGGRWPHSANKRFLELASVTDAEFYLNRVESDNILVGQLIAIHGEDKMDIGEKLIEEGIAVFDGVVPETCASEPEPPVLDNISSIEGLEINESDRGSQEKNKWYNTQMALDSEHSIVECIEEFQTSGAISTEKDGLIKYLQRLEFGKWTEEKELLALAFKLVQYQINVRNTAAMDLEAGLNFAIKTAEAVLLSKHK
ncbi:UNVERIFIED_CONTAM: hypothetical protein PYX00_003621 [Menopon gallinae]|uniref:Tudor domain-containing protein 5 n=1 Tax=Menopon gallinae TaxID=328185 RepID=A0AAW2I2L9_9NEOP